MKKLILPLLLLVAFGMLAAVESDPSEVVGYVKYDMIIGNTVVAIPMDAGYDMASDIGEGYSVDCDAVSYFGTDESWYTAYKIAPDWYDDFAVAPGSVVMVYSYDGAPFFSIGSLPAADASYSLVENGNSIVMVPLNRSDLDVASEVGDEIGTDAVSYFGTDESWYTAYKIDPDWYDDFAVSIGKPLMVYSYSATTWPTRSAVTPILNSKVK